MFLPSLLANDNNSKSQTKTQYLSLMEYLILNVKNRLVAKVIFILSPIAYNFVL